MCAIPVIYTVATHTPNPARNERIWHSMCSFKLTFLTYGGGKHRQGGQNLILEQGFFTWDICFMDCSYDFSIRKLRNRPFQSQAKIV